MDNPEVSDNELLTDTSNTLKEYEAYDLLARGYKMLSELPDFKAFRQMGFAFKAEGYRIKATECHKTYQHLCEIKKARGLE